MGALSNLLKSKHKSRYFLFLLQRRVKKNKTRLFFAKCISFFSPSLKFDKQNSRYQELREIDTQALSSKLKKEGIVNFDEPFFSESEINSIKDKLNGLHLSDPYSDYSGFVVDNIPDEVNCAHYDRYDLAKISEFINLANDRGLLQLAKEYLGATPTISNINLWWGTYGDNEPRDNELFHRDKDDYDFIKFFIYLTDVGADDYRIVYVKNSLNSNKALDKLRFTLDEVKKMFGEKNIFEAIGDQGTGFIGANYGVHNGTLPTNKNRKTLILQIQYSIRGIMVEEYKPVPRKLINGTVDNFIDPWVNRLLVK